MRRSHLLAAAVLVSAVGIWYVRRWVRSGPESPAASVVGDRLFDAVFSRIRSSSVDPLDDQELYRRAAEGVIGELDDPYATLRFSGQPALPPQDEPLAQGLFLDRRDGLAVVVGAVPGSPAETAGVRPGDVLLAIDTVPMDASRLGRAPGLLEGRVGTSFTLRVRRRTPGTLPLVVRRGPLPPSDAVEAAVLGGGVGRVRLARLGPGIEDSVRRAVTLLREQGVRSLVLDLRGTVRGGGDVAAGAAVAELFLDPGAGLVVSRMRRASGSRPVTDSAPSPFAGMPVAVLIDGGTAGAAEVVAGALQDHDRALVLGTVSFGRGVTQSSFSLGGGTTLTLTTALWLTPNGRQIQRPPRPEAGDTLPRPEVKSDAGRRLVGGGGIVPDRIIPDTTAADLVLAEARRVLMQAGTPEKVFALLPSPR